MNDSVPLPSYLAPLPQSDPQWAELNSSAYEYAYGPNPGDGYLESFQIVVFLEPHHAYRVWYVSIIFVCFNLIIYDACI